MQSCSYFLSCSAVCSKYSGDFVYASGCVLKGPAGSESRHPPTGGPLDEMQYAQHAFYRLPVVIETLPTGFFDWQTTICNASRKRLSQVLLPVRWLLLKPTLARAELQHLRVLACDLIRSVVSMGRFKRKKIRTCHIQESLARRFLIADALWSICHVVGPPMEMARWWDWLMDRLLDLPELTMSSRFNRNSRDVFVTKLLSALSVYRAGRRPSARAVVLLKRSTFCKKNSPLLFRRREYDMWREDDLAWLSRLKRTAASRAAPASGGQ